MAGLVVFTTLLSTALALIATTFYLRQQRVLLPLHGRDNTSPSRMLAVIESDGHSVTLEPRGTASPPQLRGMVDDLLHTSNRRYVTAVSWLADRVHFPTVETVTVHFVIGRDGHHDRVVETYNTRAGDARLPLSWRELRVGLTGADQPLLRSFTDLADVQVAELTKAPGEREIVLVPIEMLGSQAAALAFFKPEITADQPREWSVSYGIPGAWNPLRKTGVDVAEWTIPDTVRVEKLTIIFSFPPEAINPAVDLSGGPMTRADVTRRATEFQYELSEPPAGTYVWKVRLTGLNVTATLLDATRRRPTGVISVLPIGTALTAGGVGLALTGTVSWIQALVPLIAGLGLLASAVSALLSIHAHLAKDSRGD